MTNRASRRLVIASYNVHRCVGQDGRCAPDRIGAVILELAADIVGLQEVDSLEDGTSDLDQLAHLRRATGMHAVAGPALVRKDIGYGNALLSRRPIDRVRHFDISVPGREPRAALDTELEIQEKVVRVIVTHFGLRRPERRCQASLLLRLIQEHSVRPLVLLGDFNEWIPRGPSLRQLRRALGRSHAVRTFPTRRPLFALDRIWVHPPSLLEQVSAHRSPLARVASDHLPLVATLRW
jgi:endonuclease/exonuclease/phosphatase family metal-dependent hydrolase